VTQLSAGLAALLDDEAARERMGIAAKTRCLETFDVAVVASRYRSLYEDVIAR
jgi:glycosyltransferase involved in cell wall biosynthesis